MRNRGQGLNLGLEVGQTSPTGTGFGLFGLLRLVRGFRAAADMVGDT